MALNTIATIITRKRSKTNSASKPTSSRPQRQSFQPSPISLPASPKAVVLPCGRSRKQVLVQKLDAIPGSPVNGNPGPTFTFSVSSSSSHAPVSRTSLHRPDNDDDEIDDILTSFPLPPSESNKKTGNNTYSFHHYLPRISTSTTDFYSVTDWTAHVATHAHTEPDEQAETEAQLFGSSTSNLSLLFIEDDDFNYYPEDEPNELPRRSTQLSKVYGHIIFGDDVKVESRTAGRKLQKKKGGEVLWLEKKIRRVFEMLRTLRLRI
jgi:hypothetical protein